MDERLRRRSRRETIKRSQSISSKDKQSVLQTDYFTFVSRKEVYTETLSQIKVEHWSGKVGPKVSTVSSLSLSHSWVWERICQTGSSCVSWKRVLTMGLSQCTGVDWRSSVLDLGTHRSSFSYKCIPTCNHQTQYLSHLLHHSQVIFVFHNLQIFQSLSHSLCRTHEGDQWDVVVEDLVIRIGVSGSPRSWATMG